MVGDLICAVVGIGAAIGEGIAGVVGAVLGGSFGRSGSKRRAGLAWRIALPLLPLALIGGVFLWRPISDTIEPPSPIERLERAAINFAVDKAIEFCKERSVRKALSEEQTDRRAC